MVAGSCPGQPSDDLLIETAPARQSACIARTLGDALRDAKFDLDDASPFFAHADEMEEVRLEPLGVAGRRVDLSRKGAGWHERAPEDRDLSSDEVDSANALALALASARGSGPLALMSVYRALGGGWQQRTALTAILAP